MRLRKGGEIVYSIFTKLILSWVKNRDKKGNKKMAFVYLATNEEFMPGLIKIGMTKRDDVEERIAELSGTNMPGKFICRYKCKCKPVDVSNVEKELKELFRYCQVDARREFFKTEWFPVGIALILLTDARHAGRVHALESMLTDQEESEDSEEATGTIVSDDRVIEKRRQRYMQYVNERVDTSQTSKFYDRKLSVLSEDIGMNVYSVTDLSEADNIIKRVSRGGDIYEGEGNVGNRYHGVRAAMRKYSGFLQHAGS